MSFIHQLVRDNSDEKSSTVLETSSIQGVSHEYYDSSLDIVSSVFAEYFGKSSLTAEQRLTRNNLLTIGLLLVLSQIYFLFAQFFTVIFLAALSGLAYNQLQLQFVDWALKKKDASTIPNWENKQAKHNLIKATLLILVTFATPIFEKIFSQSSGSLVFPKDLKCRSWVLIAGQAALVCYAIDLYSNKRISIALSNLYPKKPPVLKWTFLLMLIGVIISASILLPISIYREAFVLLESFKCRFRENPGNIKLPGLSRKPGQSPYGVQVALHPYLAYPLCSQKILASNNFVRQLLDQLQGQEAEVNNCSQKLISYQKTVFGRRVFQLEADCCRWLTFANKAMLTVMDTRLEQINTKGVLQNIFGNLAWLVSVLSNISFSVYIYLTVAWFTATTFDPNHRLLRLLLVGQSKQLFSSAVSLTKATLAITLKHFALALVLLELLSLTPVNVSLSIVLAGMSSLPVFRPFWGAAAICLVKLLFGLMIGISWTKNALQISVFLSGFYFLSNTIYTDSYAQLSVEVLFVSMSVLFGMYQYGCAGIIYGPLLLILLKILTKALFEETNETSPSKPI